MKVKKKFFYLLSLLFIFVVPIVVIGYFILGQISFGELFPLIVVITIIGSIWDIWATRHGRKDSLWLWQFNRTETLGVTVFDLPIEEYVFYAAGSVYVVFIWEGIKLIQIFQNSILFAVLPLMILWTFISVFLLYRFGPKGDTVIR